MENSIAVGLQHLCVNVKARISQLSDLLGEQLNTVHRIAENDGLVNLQLQQGVKSNPILLLPTTDLGKQGVQAVNLLTLLDEGIVLGNTLQRELLHQVDLIGALQELVTEFLHCWDALKKNYATLSHL